MPKRLIYAEDAIEEIIKKLGIRDESYLTAQEEAVVQVLKDMPSAQPHQRWIPVTERLPEENDYKSCMECLDGAVWYFTKNGAMGLGHYYKCTKEWSTIGDLKTDGKVVAWMPLPEQYEGENENDST